MSKYLFYRLLFRSAYITLAMVLVWFCLNTFLSGNIWEGMTISKSALKIEYCEFNDVKKFFHQCMNTYSNLAYFFFGILLLQIAVEDHKSKGLRVQNKLERFPLLTALMGLSFVYLCFGSAFFHASLTWAGQRVDMNGTYSITIVLLGIGLYHVLFKNDFSEKGKKIWVIALIVIIASFFKLALIIPSGQLLPALILLSLIMTTTNYFQHRKERHLGIAILSLILIVVAVKIRTMDVQKMGCNPYSLYQGHSVWHLLTAMSSFCSYAFFRFTKAPNG